MKFSARIIFWICVWLVRLFLYRVRPRIVAVTGSMGKTSTCSFVSQILWQTFIVRSPNQNFNTSFGVCLTVFGATKSPGSSLIGWILFCLRAFAQCVVPPRIDILVLELGVDKKGDMHELLSIFGSYPFECSVVTECVLNHTADGQFQTLDDILSEKTQILPHAKKAFYCADTPGVWSFVPAGSVAFSRQDMQDMVSGPDGLAFSFSAYEWRVPQVFGSYLGSVFSVVLRVCQHFALSNQQIADALQTLTVPQGRGNMTYTDPFLIVDSSYNANPQSLLAFFTEMASWDTPNVRWAFVGSMNEMGDRAAVEHARVADTLCRACRPDGRPAFDIICFVGSGVDMYHTSVADGDARCFFCSSAVQAGELVPDWYGRFSGQSPILVALKGSRTGVTLEKVLPAMTALAEAKGRPHKQKIDAF